MDKFREALTKQEVCQILKVSNTTLQYYLNNRYFEELKKIGYRKRQKKLTPKQLNYLNDKIDLMP